MKNKHSFRLKLEECPSCKSGNVGVVKTLKNYTRIVFDVILGLIVYPPFSYKLRCRQCGHQFQTHEAG